MKNNLINSNSTSGIDQGQYDVMKDQLSENVVVMDFGHYLLEIIRQNTFLINPDEAYCTKQAILLGIENQKEKYIYFLNNDEGLIDSQGNFVFDNAVVEDKIKMALGLKENVDIYLFPIPINNGNAYKAYGITLYKVMH